MRSNRVEGADFHISDTRQPPREDSYTRMQTLIEELGRNSEYHWEETGGGKTRMTSPRGEDFFIRRLDKPRDPAVKRMHEFMVRQFGDDGAEALYWIRHTLSKQINDYHVIESPDGEVISLSNTQHLQLESDPRNPDADPESMVYVAHIMTDEKFRGQGLIGELYRKFYQTTLGRSSDRRERIHSIVGEATDEVEPLLNSMGRKRIYYEDSAGNIHELPYMYPPIDMDSATGAPLAEPSSAHFMVRLVDDRQDMTIDELLRILTPIFKEYVGHESDYESHDAYQRSMDYNMRMLAELQERLAQAKDGKLFFMDAPEREIRRKDLEAAGKKVYDVQYGGKV